MDRSDGEVEMARRGGRPCEPWAGEAGTDRVELPGRPEDEPAMGWSGEGASASGGVKERAMKRSRCVMEFMADADGEPAGPQRGGRPRGMSRDQGDGGKRCRGGTSSEFAGGIRGRSGVRGLGELAGARGRE